MIDSRLAVAIVVALLVIGAMMRYPPPKGSWRNWRPAKDRKIRLAEIARHERVEFRRDHPELEEV